MNLQFPNLLAFVAACSALCGAGTAEAKLAGLKVVAPDAATDKLLAEKVEVDLNGTVADALQVVVKKTGWSLIASGPSLDQRIALRTKDATIGEAMDLVLEGANMHGELKAGGKLFVRARMAEDEVREQEEEDRVTAPAPPTPPMPPAPPRKYKSDNDRAAFGQDLVVKRGETIDNAVVNGGDLIVLGRITGDAVAMGGDIVVQRGGVIEGDASAMGGDVHIEDGGIIKGSTQKFGGAFGGILKEFARRAGDPHEMHTRDHDEASDDDDNKRGGVSGIFMFRIMFGVLAFVLNIILIAFVPERIERVIETLDTRPLQAGGAGFAVLLGFLPFCLMLAVTIIGLLLVPLALGAFMLIYCVGYAALSVYIGRRMPIFVGRKTVLGAMGLGLAALTLLSLIPYIGPFVVFMVSSFAAGAVVVSRVGSGPKVIDDSIPA